MAFSKRGVYEFCFQSRVGFKEIYYMLKILHEIILSEKNVLVLVFVCVFFFFQTRKSVLVSQIPKISGTQLTKTILIIFREQKH